jgi:DNA-binding NtrC family response regulator
MTKHVLLLLDDEEELLEILVDELEEFGLTNDVKIITVNNGQEGIEAIEKHSIDCIVSDINMPIMDGIEFVKKIQADNFNKPIIFLSAHGDPDTIKKTEKLNIYSFIQKPFDSDDFCGTVSSAIKESIA